MAGDEYGPEDELAQGGEDDYDEDGSINFDADPEYAHLPPLDRNRKIRREIVRTINEVRAKFQ